MLLAIAITLLVLWAFGLVTSFSMHSYIHILLLAAIIIIMIRYFRSRNLFR